MGSTRLPGKAMKPLAGKPMIWHIWDRLTRTPGVSDVVLAITQDAKNNDMARYAAELGMYVHRGQDEDDIADRLSGAARLTRAVAVVKVDGDCPLVDPQVMAELVVAYAERDVDYVSNKYPQTHPQGLSAEVISAEALSLVPRNAGRSPRPRVCGGLDPQSL